MNLNLKNFLVVAAVGVAINTASSTVEASEIDELYVANMCNTSNAVISNYEASEDEIPNKVMKELEDSDFSFNSIGFQTKEVVVKTPKPIVKSKETDDDNIIASYGVPDGVENCDSAFKSYMGYTAVTSTTSPQWALLRSKHAYSDKKTGLRMYKGRICIAMGSFYASKIGTKINLVMENGHTVKCVLGDQKSDRHTDKTHRFHATDGSVAEMIVDYAYFDSTKQYPKELDGRIKRVEIVK